MASFVQPPAAYRLLALLRTIAGRPVAFRREYCDKKHKKDRGPRLLPARQPATTAVIPMAAIATGDRVSVIKTFLDTLLLCKNLKFDKTSSSPDQPPSKVFGAMAVRQRGACGRSEYRLQAGGKSERENLHRRCEVIVRSQIAGWQRQAKSSELGDGGLSVRRMIAQGLVFCYPRNPTCVPARDNRIWTSSGGETWCSCSTTEDAGGRRGNREPGTVN